MNPFPGVWSESAGPRRRGQHTSMMIGTDGLPTISYFDVTNGDLKVAKCGNAACSGGNTLTKVAWKSVAFGASVPVGEFSSVTIGTDSLPVVSYFNSWDGNLEVVKCANQFCLNGWSRR